MKISVIIPIYKVEKYVERCINSVLSQTYRNLEVILVDDCTPDRSMEIARECIELSPLSKDLLFLFLRHDYNRGLSAARNTGTKAATGEYILYVDSDDELPNDSIELLCTEAVRKPGIEMVQGSVKTIPHDDKYDINNQYVPCYLESNKNIRFHYYYLPRRIIPSTAWNKLLLKSFITKHQLSFKEGLIHEDELWMYEVVKVLSNCSIITNVTYLHYSTDESIINTETLVQRSYYWNIILNEVLDKLDEPLLELQLLTYTLFAKLMLNMDESRDKRLMLRMACKHFKNQSYIIAVFLMIYSLFYPCAGRRLYVSLYKRLSIYSKP